LGWVGRVWSANKPGQGDRPGVAERIGIGEAAIRVVAPKLVYDPLVQAISGLATVQAGVDLGKELRRSAPPTDDERRILFNQDPASVSAPDPNSVGWRG